MTWAKLDDLFPQHRKVRRLSDPAFRLHVTAICASAHDLTDGHLTVEDVEDLTGVRHAVTNGVSHDPRDAPAIAELVSRGLWDEVEDGWVIHDYLDYNPSSDKVKDARAKAAERQRKWREARDSAREAARDEAVQGSESDGVRNGVTDDVTNAAPYPTRTRTRTPTKERTPSEFSPTDRPDVEELLDHLEERIRENGSKVPTRGKAARTAMRLLIDKDGRAVADVHKAIDWCQDDQFWRANILSAAKLREKYDQLRLAASRPAGGSGVPLGTDRQALILRAERERAVAADAAAEVTNVLPFPEIGA